MPVPAQRKGGGCDRLIAQEILGQPGKPGAASWTTSRATGKNSPVQPYAVGPGRQGRKQMPRLQAPGAPCGGQLRGCEEPSSGL